MPNYALRYFGMKYSSLYFETIQGWLLFQDAMDGLNFSATECHLVFQVLAVVLKLGICSFFHKPMSTERNHVQCSMIMVGLLSLLISYRFAA